MSFEDVLTAVSPFSGALPKTNLVGDLHSIVETIIFTSAAQELMTSDVGGYHQPTFLVPQFIGNAWQIHGNSASGALNLLRLSANGRGNLGPTILGSLFRGGYLSDKLKFCRILKIWIENLWIVYVFDHRLFVDLFHSSSYILNRLPRIVDPWNEIHFLSSFLERQGIAAVTLPHRISSATTKGHWHLSGSRWWSIGVWFANW